MTDSLTPAHNPYVGTWKLVSAVLHHDGKSELAFGERPIGTLSFSADMHYVEVLMDADTPRFASNQIGNGTDEENRAVAAKTIGIFGTYQVDSSGAFIGDRVDGCTFPNWIGDVRTRKDIEVHVDNDRLSERFHQPGGATIDIVWARAR